MTEKDMDKTTFITENGVYCYRVMPFWLKNTGATYQRLVNKIFEELIKKTMEVYIDDMFVKSIKEDDHLNHLGEAFSTMKKYGMKLNPNKCTFSARGGKFLGFMVNKRSIEANLKKINSLRNEVTIINE